MSPLTIILSFIAGAACGLFFYKNKFKNRINFINKKFDALNSGHSIRNKTLLTDTIDNLPPEFSSMLEKIDKLIQVNNRENINQDQNKETTDSTETLKKTIDNLYIVNELGRKVTSSLSLQQTFKHLYTTINSMMDAAVLELNVQNEFTGVRKVFSNSQDNSETNEMTYINHMSDWCFKNNREVFLTDAENDFARYVFQPLILPDGRIAKSVIIFPVINNNIVSGTLCIISFQKNSFSDYHREIIRLLLGYISVALDNAMRHEELNLTKIRAEQSEKFKEQFLANMSHEIRTPINAVTGMTSLLLEKQPRHDQLRYLESIRNASDSLLVIINDILDLSKIEAGKVELEKIDFSVSDTVKIVKEIMHFKAEEKGLNINDHIDENIPPVLIGDPTRLTQILINLIGNAIKFTDKGIVSITVTSEGQNRISLSGDNSDTSAGIRFEVTDTGIGITEEQQSKLFQNYAQASTETSRKFGGTGLGLSISSQLVKMQGGCLTVKSKPGLGSTFSFTLSFPLSKNKSIAVKEKSISEEMLHDLKGIRILMAEDNEYNRIVVKETLELKIDNIIVDEAFDGEMAVEMLREKDYDVVLMDLVMPKMDGLEATRFIRNKFPSPKNNIQIIALTASVVKSEIDKCNAAGMNAFIPKPFKSHELLGAIYNAIKNENKSVFETEQVLTNHQKPKGDYIDQNYLYEYTEGDEERMQRYIDLFLTKTPESIQIIKSALSENDYDKIRVTVHSMKPQLRINGIIKGLAITESIEQCCIENKNTDQLPGLIENLSSVCTLAIEELKAMVLK